MSKDRESRKLSKKEQSRISRRRFLQSAAIVGGGGTLGIIGILKLGEAINNSRFQAELESFHSTIFVPDYNLPDNVKPNFLDEDWIGGTLHSQPPANFNQMNQKEQEQVFISRAKNAFDTTINKLASSVYQPFREAAQLYQKGISAYANKQDGAINLRFGYVSMGDQPNMMDFMLMKPVVFPGGFWGEEMIVNVYMLDSRFMRPYKSLWSPLNWAITLCHELKGHYELDIKSMGYWIGKGKNKEEAVQLLRQDEYQEPYAYAVQSNITMPLLDIKNAKIDMDVLADSNLKILSQWIALKSRGVSWTDSTWIALINDHAK